MTSEFPTVVDPMIPRAEMNEAEMEGFRSELFSKPLSPREKEIMLLQAQGLNLNEISNLIGITRNTTNRYVRRLHEKIGVETSVEMIIRASETGLIDTAQLIDPNFDPSIFDSLSPKEKEVAGLLSTTGFTNKEIATKMDIDENTVKKHMYSIFDKTGNRKRIQLVVCMLEAKRRAERMEVFGQSSDVVDSQGDKDLPETNVLTPREAEILKLISRGMPHKEIAHALSIDIFSVRNYTTAIYRKWGINTQTSMIKIASDLGLIDTAQLVGPRFNPDVFDMLTTREMQIVDLITDRGLMDKEIAGELKVRRGTISNRLVGIYAVTGFSSRVELVVGVLEARRRAKESAKKDVTQSVEVQVFPALAS